MQKLLCEKCSHLYKLDDLRLINVMRENTQKLLCLKCYKKRQKTVDLQKLEIIFKKVSSNKVKIIEEKQMNFFT